MSIQVITWFKQTNSCQNTINVLPFYSFSFEKLNNDKDYLPNYDYNSDFRTITKEIISKINFSITPNYFYDIRNWEDYSCAAPEYMLLDEINWNSTKPFAFTIKNQIDLYLVFEHMEITMPDNTCACVAITLSDDNGQYDSLIMFVKKNSTEKTFALSFNDFISPKVKNNSNSTVPTIYDFFLNWEPKNGVIEFQNDTMIAKINYEKGDRNALLQFNREASRK